MSIEPAIHAENVVLYRGKARIVPDLDMTVQSGSIYGLVGPSGSGKTTVMRAMMGLGEIHAGTMSILSQPAGASSLRSEIGYLPQNDGVWLDLTARESLSFMASIYRVSASAVDDALALTEIGSVADRPISTLSGGQARRVGLALATLHRPRLLILDEPTVGLDPRLRRRFWTIFRAWAAKGTTIVVSTHVMDEAELCDRVALMVEGKVIAEGAPDDIVAGTHTSSLEDAVLALIEKEIDDVA